MLAVAAIGVLRVASPSTFWSIQDRVAGQGPALGAVVAVLATAGSLWYSEAAHFPPCELCWYQRIAMYPLALLLVMAAVRRDTGIRPYGMALAGAGLAVSLWHNFIETFPDCDPGGCDPANPCAVSVGGEAEKADAVPRFGPVVVEGASPAPLPVSDTDPAVGTAAPVVSSIDREEDPTTIGGPGEPTIVAFLAHYCPHCQAELPVLVDLQENGTFDGVRTVAVLTGTVPDAPNYPPVAWLEREGWDGDVLLDDDESTAASAYGLTAYPFLVALDADGNVVARVSGELPPADLAALAAAARGEG